MPLLQGGAWARGPRGLEGSFPLWAPACPSGPSGVTRLPLFLAAAWWGWAVSSPISSLPLTLRSSPGPGLIVLELGALGGKGWSSPKASLEPGHLPGPGRTPAVTAPLRASGAIRGSVRGSVQGLSSRAGLGRAPRNPHLASLPRLLTVPGEVPRDPALQVREPAAHPSRHVVVLRVARPGCCSRACPPRLQLPPPPHPLPLFFLFDERLFTGVGDECGADGGSGHRAEGPRLGQVTSVASFPTCPAVDRQGEGASAGPQALLPPWPPSPSIQSHLSPGRPGHHGAGRGTLPWPLLPSQVAFLGVGAAAPPMGWGSFLSHVWVGVWGS